MISDERLRNMAKPSGILEWYRGERPRAIPGKSSNRRSSLWMNFDEEEWAIICEQRKRKQGVRDAIEFYSNMRGPHGMSTREGWLIKCSLKRMLLKKFPEDENRAKWIDEHRRTINCVRIMRFVHSQRCAGISEYPFYVEPNTNFVSYEDVPVAEKNGVVFHRAIDGMTHGLFNRLFRRFQKPGRIKGFWSAKSDLDDEFDHNNPDVPIRCEFMFSDPAELDKLTEELVWIKMRF